jgi:hypothetical protein
MVSRMYPKPWPAAEHQRPAPTAPHSRPTAGTGVSGFLAEEFTRGSARSQHADRFRDVAGPTLGFLSSLYPGHVPQLLAVGQSVEESSGNRIMVEGRREIGRSTAGGIEHASTWEAVRVCSAGPFGLLGLIATSLV